jgi:hypothetical protein
LFRKDKEREKLEKQQKEAERRDKRMDKLEKQGDELTGLLRGFSGAKDTVRLFAMVGVSLLLNLGVFVQNAPKISSKYKTLRAFLADVEAADKEALFVAEEITLQQLPNLSEEQLSKLGLKMGPANRIFSLAQKFVSG